MENKETIKLYDDMPYETYFTATVLSCEKVEDNKKNMYHIVLDKTLFFPEEGGQTPDKGMINDVSVEDVQIKKGIITHIVKCPLEPGMVVTGEIDWKHRFYNMQQHTGEHIFSGLIHKKYGYDNVGFHLSDQIVTMDFNGVINKEEAENLEREVNEVICSNRKVRAWYPTKEEMKRLEYRSKKELEGAIRIVEIDGADICACCAPHVANTGEIGIFKIMNLQNYKGGVRISFLCGMRALKTFSEKSEVISQISQIMSKKQEELVLSIEELKKQNQNLKYQLMENNRNMLCEKINAVSKEEENVLLFVPQVETPVLREAVNQLTEERLGLCAVFSGTDKDGYQFILGSTKEDCQSISKMLRESLEAKCGGSSQMIQGSIMKTKQEIEEKLEELYS